MRLNLIQPHLTLKSLALTIAVLFTFSCSHTKENENSTPAEITVLSEYIFSPTTEISTQIEQTLIAAKSQNKQALFVLGAQWCHDSRGLAQKFSTPQMQAILKNNYQVLFIDVGYLEKGFDVVKQFNLPVYYGTPTVIIVEPNSAKILNRSTMQKWLSADNVPLTEYIKYFDSFASNNKKAAKVSIPMQAYLSEINKFEQQQALRLKKAYGVVGPLLKQYKESENKESSSEFFNKWQQVQGFRYRIQDDIQTLITQAKSNVAAGTSEPLTLPTYPAFTWE